MVKIGVTVSRSALLIVDVYGDGAVLRVFDNTPSAQAALREFRQADQEFTWRPLSADADPPQFTDFMEARGCIAYTTETVNL